MNTEWIDINDRLPEAQLDNSGDMNGVIAYLATKPDMGFRYMVSNAQYVRMNPSLFLYWMPLPLLPTPLDQSSNSTTGSVELMLLEVAERLGMIRERGPAAGSDDSFALSFAEGLIYGFARQQKFEREED